MASQGQDARLLWMVKPSQRALDGPWVLGHIATSPHRQGPSHRLTSWQGPVGACPRSPGLAIPLPIDIVTIGKPVVTRWDTGAQRLRRFRWEARWRECHEGAGSKEQLTCRHTYPCGPGPDSCRAATCEPDIRALVDPPPGRWASELRSMTVDLNADERPG